MPESFWLCVLPIVIWMPVWVRFIALHEHHLLAIEWTQRTARRLFSRMEMRWKLRRNQPFGLYLRSFAEDSTSFSGATVSEIRKAYGRHPVEMFTIIAMLRPWSLESMVIAKLSHRHPIYAVGRPGENMPADGAGRLYVDNVVWKDVVTQMIDQCDYMVISVADSDGLRWEISRVIERDALNKTIFLLVDRDGEPCLDRFFDLADLINSESPEKPPVRFALSADKRMRRAFGQAQRSDIKSAVFAFVDDDRVISFSRKPGAGWIPFSAISSKRLAFESALDRIPHDAPKFAYLFPNSMMTLPKSIYGLVWASFGVLSFCFVLYDKVLR